MKKLANYGYVQFFKSGEYHHNSPLLMKTLHKVRKASPGKERGERDWEGGGVTSAVGVGSGG